MSEFKSKFISEDADHFVVQWVGSFEELIAMMVDHDLEVGQYEMNGRAVRGMELDSASSEPS